MKHRTGFFQNSPNAEKKEKFTNQAFCYWLQGYFEISESGTLDAARLLLIQLFLQRIEEPWGDYTTWLANVIAYLEFTNFDEKDIAIFTPIIKEELNFIFLHVIDPTYDEDHAREKLLAIHFNQNINVNNGDIS